MAADDPKFSCTACGKEYRWKPELAGRKAKCGCGAALVVPAGPPGGGDPAPAAKPAASAPAALPSVASATPAPNAKPIDAKPTDDAAVGRGSCPSCGAALAAGAVLCVNCGYNLKTGQTLSVVVESGDDDEPLAEAPPGKPAKRTA